MVSLRSQLRLLLTLGSLSLFAATAASQAPVPKAAGSTRAELIARLRIADSLGLRAEAFVLRTRLRDGDYEEGDRIDVTYEGAGLKKADSLVVESGKVLRLGDQMGDLNIRGLLRPEVADSIRARVDRYYKNEVVHVVPRLRISVSGAVRSPGTLYARSDMLLSDVITRAGGQDQTTDLRNVVIRRGQEVIWGKEDVLSALSGGMTLDRLELQPGDEVVVGARSNSRGLIWVQFGASILTAVLIPLLINRR